MNTHFFSDTSVMLARSMRHVTRSLDTIITVTITPIAIMLLFVYVFGGAIQAGTRNYVNYLMPGILLIAIASGISYTAVRLFNDLQSGIFERFHSMPIARSSVLWGHVLTSLVSNAISVVVIVLVALLMGFRSPAGVLAWLAVAGILVLFTLALTWIAVIAGLLASSIDGASAFSYPTRLPAVRQLGIRAHCVDAWSRACLRGKPAGHFDRQHDQILVRAAAGRWRNLDRPRVVRRHRCHRLCASHGGLPAQNSLKYRWPSCRRPLVHRRPKPRHPIGWLSHK